MRQSGSWNKEHQEDMERFIYRDKWMAVCLLCHELCHEEHNMQNGPYQEKKEKYGNMVQQSLQMNALHLLIN